MHQSINALQNYRQGTMEMIRMLDNVKADEKGILAAEMSWLRNTEGISKLQKIRSDYTTIFRCPNKSAGKSHPAKNLMAWRQCQLTESHTCKF